MKFFWNIGGFVSLALGILGIGLPILPTVPFLILAAFCFARGSDRLHHWLVNHPRFGPPIRDWQEKRAISRKAKLLASTSMAAVFALSLALGLRWTVLAIQAVCLAGAALFIWSRPDG